METGPVARFRSAWVYKNLFKTKTNQCRQTDRKGTTFSTGLEMAILVLTQGWASLEPLWVSVTTLRGTRSCSSSIPLSTWQMVSDNVN